MKYRFINEHRHEYAVQRMCRVLSASPSGFYEWLKRPLSDRAIEDQRLLVLIRASYTASSGVYGYRRVHLDLREVGESCGKHRVARIMKINGIVAIHGYKIPRGAYGRPSIITPNKLQREFTVKHPDRAWVTDITYSAPSPRRRLKDYPGREHVWNVEDNKEEERQSDTGFSRRKSASRSGGDRPCTGRVT